MKKLSAKLHPPLTDLVVKDQKTSNNPVTFVTHKRLGVLVLLQPCCVNSVG